MDSALESIEGLRKLVIGGLRYRLDVFPFSPTNLASMLSPPEEGLGRFVSDPYFTKSQISLPTKLPTPPESPCAIHGFSQSGAPSHHDKLNTDLINSVPFFRSLKIDFPQARPSNG